MAAASSRAAPPTATPAMRPTGVLEGGGGGRGERGGDGEVEGRGGGDGGRGGGGDAVSDRPASKNVHSSF